MSSARGIDWRAVAESVGRAIPRIALNPAVVALADRAGPHQRWAVAVSGGADSLATLFVLWTHWPERRRRLLVLHFNHRLRGREALADARFCRSVCAALGVSLAEGAWRDARRGASEAEARAARFAFFDETLRRRKIHTFWFGHHRDDVAESMLMRLARGSGAAGLAAPRPVQLQMERVHLRPLLNLSKAQILERLLEAGAIWREDASNREGDYFRNRVRHRVLPAWSEAAGRDALAGAALSRELLEEDDTALETWALGLAPKIRGGLLLKSLTVAPRAVLRRVLRRWLNVNVPASDLARPAFERLLELVTRGQNTRFSLGTNSFAVIANGQLRCEKRRARSKSGSKLSR